MEELTYCYKYPRPSVTTDCVIFGYDEDGLSVLLVQRGIDPYKGCWAFPGGFLQMDEDAETGARRELREETGFETDAIEQFRTFTAVDRDPRGRVITIAFYALVRKGKVRGGDDAAAAQWFPVNELPPLAFDHEQIFRVASDTLKEKMHFQPIGFNLLPETFTLSQLQKLYECILGVTFDSTNVAEKMLRNGIISPVEDGSEQQAEEKPQTYRFNAEKYTALKAGGFRLEI